MPSPPQFNHHNSASVSHDELYHILHLHHIYTFVFYDELANLSLQSHYRYVHICVQHSWCLYLGTKLEKWENILSTRISITMRVGYWCLSVDHAGSTMQAFVDRAIKYSRYIFSQLQSLLISGCPIKSFPINVKNILRHTDNRGGSSGGGGGGGWLCSYINLQGGGGVIFAWWRHLGYKMGDSEG